MEITASGKGTLQGMVMAVYQEKLMSDGKEPFSLPEIKNTKNTLTEIPDFLTDMIPKIIIVKPQNFIYSPISINDVSSSYIDSLRCNDLDWISLQAMISTENDPDM